VTPAGAVLPAEAALPPPAFFATAFLAGVFPAVAFFAAAFFAVYVLAVGVFAVDVFAVDVLAVDVLAMGAVAVGIFAAAFPAPVRGAAGRSEAARSAVAPWAAVCAPVAFRPAAGCSGPAAPAVACGSGPLVAGRSVTGQPPRREVGTVRTGGRIERNGRIEWNGRIGLGAADGGAADRTPHAGPEPARRRTADSGTGSQSGRCRAS
jgi:hypothetical protein